jgi:hypothetical protein
LSITTTLSSCEVTIDGVRVGATPLAALPVAAGRHHVVCAVAGQSPVEADVDVAVGSGTQYRFALDGF